MQVHISCDSSTAPLIWQYRWRGTQERENCFKEIKAGPDIIKMSARQPQPQEIVSGSGLVWHNLSPPHPFHISVRLFKSSSNWTKSSMMSPQLFLGWYQIISDVFRCSQLFCDVLSCFPMFSAIFLTGWQFLGRSHKNIARFMNAVQITFWLSVPNPQCLNWSFLLFHQESSTVSLSH